MNKFQPSFTALTAAAARAAHLVVDDPPVIFADTLASAVLGGLASQLTDYHRGQPAHPILSAARAQVLCRARFAEDCVTRTAARQYVVLGAGLDTFAYRSAAAAGLRIFEVDHPATQGWKRAALAAAKITPAGFLRYVPADLATDSLAGALRAGGLDFTEPAIVSWLGVTMYLREDAIRATLAALARLAPGSELIADYMLPAGLRDEAGDLYVEQIGPAAAARGEPWRTFLAREQMAALLSGYGFTVTGHIQQADSIPAPLWVRTDSLAPIALSQITTAMLSPEAIPGRP